MRVRVGSLVVLLALAATPAFAQDMLSYGLKVGVNFADLNFGQEESEGDGDEKRKLGLAIGGFVDVPVAPLFSIQPEFLYTQKGTKFEGDDDFGSFKATLHVDMIQIPVLGKVKVDAGEVRPFVVFGPGFGFVTRGKQKAEFDGATEEEDFKDDIQSVEVSLIIGGGVQFGKGSVEARYDHGLRNLNKEEDEETVKTRTFSILFGYGWP